MIALPERQTGPASLPWLCYVWLLVSLVLLLTWQREQPAHLDQLHRDYVASGLLDAELPVYASWLRMKGDIRMAYDLEQARAADDTRTVFDRMAFDPAFDAMLDGDTSRYWSADEKRRWREYKAAFQNLTARLPRERAGLNPAQPRPASFLTLHLLSPSYLLWLVCALALLFPAWALEGSLGRRRMLILWPAAGILAALLTALLLRPDHTVVAGGHILVSAAVGLYLGYFGLRRVPVLMPGKSPASSTRQWPAAVFALPWLLVPAATVASGQHWIAPLTGLLSGLLLVQLVRVPGLDALPGATDRTEQTTALPANIGEALTLGWEALGRLAFPDARQHFTRALTLIDALPDASPLLQTRARFDALSGLFQLEKLDLGNTHDITADITTDLLSLPVDDPDQRRQQHRYWREAREAQGDTQVLPAPAARQLAARFASIDAVSDAEALLSGLPEPEDEQDSAAHQQALRALADAFTARGQLSKAKAYAAAA